MKGGKMEVTTVRVEGTFSDDVDVEHEEGASEEEILEKARMAWRYTEFVDMSAKLA